MKNQLLFSIYFLCCFGVAISQIENRNVQFKSTNNVTRKILLENYGGNKCGNCPRASLEAEQIEAMYPNDVAILNIQAGFFANTNTTYSVDLRCQAGNDWDNFFGISAAGNPNGMVNRMDFPTNYIINYTNWQPAVVSFIGQLSDFDITISKNYNAPTRLLDVDVKIKFLNNLNNIYKLVVVLSEDSVVTTQLDYSLPIGSQIESNYNYNHVLRDALNGSMGTLVNTGAVLLNDSVIQTITNYSVNPNFNDNNLQITAFVYDTISKEVFQVNKTKMKVLTTNIRDYSNSKLFAIYPNPANETFIIKMLNIIENDITYKIIDQFGRLLLSGKLSNELTEINLQNLESGVYTLSIGDRSPQSFKLIKR